MGEQRESIEAEVDPALEEVVGHALVEGDEGDEEAVRGHALVDGESSEG